ncbi:hypothetical protein EU538_09525 [Candidatus Thorarchaeota archaeon]|nr:MAG: hypothetical protein EU538_09525 [Candidatus Thorarchaeota archaeon]
MYSIRVSHHKMSFSAAHFVLEAGGCERLHGHNYFVEIYVEGPVDDLGMVMDFRDLKRDAIGICEKMDHRFLIPGDSEAIHFTKEADCYRIVVSEKEYVLPMSDCVILPITATTSEYLAEHIARSLDLPEGLSVEVCVQENVGSQGCYRIPST